MKAWERVAVILIVTATVVVLLPSPIDTMVSFLAGLILGRELD